MAKRKCGVNDIIYELDNDDTLSSEDEVKEPKIIRIGENRNPNGIHRDSNTQGKAIEIIDIDSSVERINDPLTPEGIQNGGKSPIEFIVVDEVSETASPSISPSKLNKDKKYNNSDIVFEEDIIVDSPASNSDLGVVGCENRTPLVAVKFRDCKLAMNYKKQIKAFMLNLIKLHGNALDSDNDTDLELDIWPEDLEDYEEPEKPADDLFFVDTDPNDNMPIEIPSYSQNASLISHPLVKEPTPPPMMRRKGPICFNCNGNHTMRECKEPLNNARIAENRKAMVKKGRYHVEDEQKYGHLMPGRISGNLRHALGLKRHELPLHIYRMRHLGYPPGWLEEARISHSGITLFDSSGQATLDPEDEEGELVEPGCKDKYDIKKIHDFPGFNVPASSRYKEEAHALGLPPMSEADSKMSMLTVLAPNAVQAYKRKKLALFPARPGDAAAAGAAAEMDIDSGDETLDFPSQPPLPDDAPPPPPPPPDVPPPPDSPPPLPPPPPPEDIIPQQNTTTKTDKEANSKEKEASEKPNTDSDDDLEVVEVMKVRDIPIPKMDIITIDVDGDVSEPESGLPSPSLDDLEQKKRLLLDALDTDEPTRDKTDVTQDHDNKAADVKDKDEAMVVEPVATIDVDNEDGSAEDTSVVEVVDEKVDSSNEKSEETVDMKPAGTEPVIENRTGENVNSDKLDVDSMVGEKANVENVVGEKLSSVDKSNDNEVPSTTDDNIQGTIEPTNATASTSSPVSTPKANEAKSTETDVPKTPTSSMGLVRGTEYGTPVINVASPYVKLPSDDKFAKDICDVINFENLPNSTGKYKKISTLLKKVKSEVDRIQES